MITSHWCGGRGTMSDGCGGCDSTSDRCGGRNRFEGQQGRSFGWRRGSGRGYQNHRGLLLLPVAPLLDVPEEAVPVQPLGPSELVQGREVSRIVGIVGVLLTAQVLQTAMKSHLNTLVQ